MRVADTLQAPRSSGQRFFPACRAKMRPRIGRIDGDVPRLWRIDAADQRIRQPMRMVHIVEAEAALDTQPVLVGGTITAVDVENRLILDLVGDLTSAAAVWADP